MSVVGYAFQEARHSLRRGGRGALMSIGTIAIAFMALGGSLLVTSNLERYVARWMESAEVSVYLRDEITDGERETVRAQLSGDRAVVRVDFISKAAAQERFSTDFPELADLGTALGADLFPQSFEVRLAPGTDVADRAAAIAQAVIPLDGVADVQFDRRWLERLLSIIAGVRLAGLAVTLVLLLGAAFTVTAVVGLSLQARREELEIMRLVGAPLGFIRGPFVMEGLLLGAMGAGLALGLLAVSFWAVRGWTGLALGPEGLGFLSLPHMGLLAGAALTVGGLAGLVASRAAR